MCVAKIMFSLIRTELCGETADQETIKGLSADELSELYALSNAHDLAHIIGSALSKCGKLGSDLISEKFRRKAMLAVSRYECLNYEFNRICEELEAAEIPFLPLKGSVIRAFYPEPWLRTSCDIDVLVHPENLEKATDLLVKRLEYTKCQLDTHDISLYAGNGVHLELHYDLLEKGTTKAADVVSRNVWEYVSPKKNYVYWQEVSGEFFYFYHIAHMAKHFYTGGCGIRPFVDLWILDQLVGMDRVRQDALLRQGNLLHFANVVRKLSRIWFEREETDDVFRQMEEFILSGGVYGIKKNHIAVQQEKVGGRLKYTLARVFVHYDVINLQYPILQKHRWLMPVMQVCRWCRLIFSGQTRRIMREMKYSYSISPEDAENMRIFLNNIGL